MASAFDREVIHTLEKPLSTDVNEIGSYGDFALRSAIMHLMGGSTSYVGGDGYLSPHSGFLNDSFKVRPVSPQFGVSLQAGIGFASAPGDLVSAVGGVSGLDDLAQFKPMVLTTNQVIPVDAAPSSGTRCDIIEVTYDRQLANPTSRLVLNPSTQQFAPSTVTKLLTWALDGQTGRVVSPAASTAPISYKVGDSSGNPPEVTSGYYKIADIVVPAGTIVLTLANIRDERRMIVPGGVINIDGTISVPSNAVGTVGTMIISTNAPPGVEVYLSCAAASGIAGGQATVFVLAGRPDQAASLVANTELGFLSGFVNNQVLAYMPIIGRINSSQQTLLAGTNCYPYPRAVSVGAGYVAFSLGATHFNSDGTQNYSGLAAGVSYGFHLAITPGATAEISY